MKQFYETYSKNEVVSPLVTQISWTNHLLILSSTNSDEEREFYIKLCLKEKYCRLHIVLKELKIRRHDSEDNK